MRAQVTAVMGFGRFGRALCELLDGRGGDVRAWDPHLPVDPRFAVESPRALVDGASTLVLCVPIAATRAAITGILPRVLEAKGEPLVLDVGSVKLQPAAVMDELLGDALPWIASHPLFGPSSLARGEPLRVVLCPNPRRPDALARARSFYEALDCAVVEQTADEHDRAMAQTHALAFFIAKGLIDIGAGEDLAFVPPSFHAVASAVESVREDAGHLFRAIQHDNPHAASSRRALLDALQNVDDHLAQALEAPGVVDPALEIPELSAAAPELLETRDRIDALDRELVELLARRVQLSRRAGLVKAARGLVVRDPARERALLESRADWARARGLDGAAARELFELILRQSRGVQRR
ncbi:MAG: prephenate dehydrogenase/arogenate dehydrogenase family protein [Myxococcales bacterium]|nr:prephenate dehydrogenase/arogenate dehydrogenase family protein [Myxococcales bacterium]